MLLPPIRITGDWPGASARSRLTRIGLTAASRGRCTVQGVELDRDARRSPAASPARSGAEPTLRRSRAGRGRRGGRARSWRRRRWLTARAARPRQQDPEAQRQRGSGGRIGARAAACTGPCCTHTTRSRRASASTRQASTRAPWRPQADTPSHPARPCERGRVRADRSRHHHRLLGGREVDRDGRLRGRGLLLRRQPALGDDPHAGRAVHARGIEGGPGGGRLRRAGWQLLRGADARCSTRCARRGRTTACCSSRPTSRRC